MSMTVVNARIYVARIIGGGGNSQEALDMADEAILRTYQDWQTKKLWRWLQKDTSATTSVTATIADASAVVAAPSAGAFDFVNVGQTVTYAGVSGSIPANTTVASYTRGADGVITSITLSNVCSEDETGVLTFSADIPVVAGSNDYNLPRDFYKPFTAMMQINRRTLVWKDQRWFDRIVYDETTPGFVTCYTTYNPVSELSQDYGTKRLKFERAPSEADILRLRYYRTFNPSGTYLDIPDELQYVFLDYARNVLLATKRAQDDPQNYANTVFGASEQAAKDDEEPTDDNDNDQCMKSQYEMGGGSRQLWHNGEFNDYNW